VLTGSGGLHIYFQFDPAHPPKNKARFADGLDMRSEGGYVVAPPSKHHTGNLYKWVKGTKDLEVPELPDWLLELVQTNQRVEVSFRDYLRRVPPAISGQNGSAVTFAVACEAAKRGIRDFQDFLTQVDLWNQKCEPPWSEPELQHKFEDAWARVENEPNVDLPVNSKGNFISNSETLGRILEEDPRYRNRLTYNEMRQSLDYDGKRLRDPDITAIKRDILRRYESFTVSTAELEELIAHVADKNSHNPLREWLESLEWDGQERIYDLLEHCLRIKRSKLYYYYIRKWMLGAVRRVMEPGCKMDNVLMLVGPQGIYKSTFFRVLAGDEYFSDVAIDLNNKDSQMAIQTCWIHEWAELENVTSNYRVSKIKSFLGQQADTFRKPYARNVEVHPRRNVFCGTTNDPGIISDPTGARRFWIILTRGKYNMKWLRDNREQLWAEAVARYEMGELPVLPRKAEQARTQQESFFYTEDPLRDLVDFAEELVEEQGSFELRDICIKAKKTSLNRSEQMGLAKFLRMAGFHKRRQNGKNVWTKGG
jgi:hypothetical protein